MVQTSRDSLVNIVFFYRKRFSGEVKEIKPKLGGKRQPRVLTQQMEGEFIFKKCLYALSSLVTRLVTNNDSFDSFAWFLLV